MPTEYHRRRRLQPITHNRKIPLVISNYLYILSLCPQFSGHQSGVIMNNAYKPIPWHKRPAKLNNGEVMSIIILLIYSLIF